MKNEEDSGAAEPARTQYLLTGAGGFVGREIASQLREKGYPVRGLVRRINPNIPMPDGVELVSGDILDPVSLDALFEGVGPGNAVLIHTAALISVRRLDLKCERVNLAGTENVLAACKKFGVRRLVHLASVDALHSKPGGGPLTEPARFEPDGLRTSYERSKAAAAQRVLDAAKEGLDCALLLPSAVIGPGDYRGGFITRMVGAYLSLFPRVSVAGGYDFVDVRDVAAAAIAVSMKSGRGDCYILNNRYAGVTDVFGALASRAGRKPPLVTLPLSVLYPIAPLAALAFMAAGREPPLTPDALRLMRVHPAYCHDKAARELGFSPRPLEETLGDTADFLLARRGRGNGSI